jgi:hypothetical protein
MGDDASINLTLIFFRVKYHVLCKSENLGIIAAILVAYYGILLLIGVIFAVVTRHVNVSK